MRDFKKLKVWQLGMEIATDVYDFINFFPPEERYGLRSQMTRAAVSVPSNIAEGGSRASKREYIYYLRTALGSLFELETQLLLSKEIGITEEPSDKIVNKVIEGQKMLSILIKRNQDALDNSKSSSDNSP